MIEKEPITVILSQRGWIRAMRGHVALGEIADLKWREGDGPHIHFHAQTTDRLLVAADNGRVYTLGGDKLPGGRGFGEPIRLTIDLEAEGEIVAMMVVRPERKLLVASIRRARVRDQRRGDAGRDAQGQAAGESASRGEGGGGEAGGGGRGRGRGDRREPEDAGVPARRAARAGARVGRAAAALPRRRAVGRDGVRSGRRDQLAAGRGKRADAGRNAT